MLWSLAAGATFAYYRCKDWFWPGFCVKRPQLLLIGTILLAVFLLAVSPIYYPNMTLTENGGMNYCPLFDGSLRAGIANELTHSIPPQNLIFSGRL
jgi:hypothetical protein